MSTLPYCYQFKSAVVGLFLVRVVISPLASLCLTIVLLQPVTAIGVSLKGVLVSMRVLVASLLLVLGTVAAFSVTPCPWRRRAHFDVCGILRNTITTYDYLYRPPIKKKPNKMFIRRWVFLGMPIWTKSRPLIEHLPKNGIQVSAKNKNTASERRQRRNQSDSSVLLSLDVNPGKDTTVQFQEINHAYEVLTKQHERFGDQGRRRGGGGTVCS